jgi:hypothetical protein
MPVAKWFILSGVLLLIVGMLLYFSETRALMSKVFGFLGYLGKLPGDIHYKKENFSFYFPITTMLLISLVLHFGIRLFKMLHP